MTEKKRTITQNRALHLYFTQMAKALNLAGLDMRIVIKPEIDIPWSPYNVKEFIWKPVLNAMFGKKSTKEMATTEIDEILETINRHLSEKFGAFGYSYLPFPSLENLLNELDKTL